MTRLERLVDALLNGNTDNVPKGNTRLEKIIRKKIDAGGIGGGSTGGGSPFIVTLDVDVSSGTMAVSDKGKDVMDEIDSNYKAGNPVNAVINYTVTMGSRPLTVTLWLVAVQNDNYFFMTAGGTYIIICPDVANRWSASESA